MVHKWCCMRGSLSTSLKTLGKQEKSLMTSVTSNHRIVLRMGFCAPPRYRGLKWIYFNFCYSCASVGSMFLLHEACLYDWLHTLLGWHYLGELFDILLLFGFNFVLFLIQGSCVTALSWNSLSRPNWPQIHNDMTVSASLVQGINA